MQAFHPYRQPSDFLQSALAACVKVQSCEAVVLQHASLAHSVSAIQGRMTKTPRKRSALKVWHLQVNLSLMQMHGWDGPTAACCGEKMPSLLRSSMLM